MITPKQEAFAAARAELDKARARIAAERAAGQLPAEHLAHLTTHRAAA